jgi:hypothetical protein
LGHILIRNFIKFQLSVFPFWDYRVISKMA